jgi:tetratricopeptide (TPR) repeat protein
MSLEKLKDSARKFEQKEDWRKAIEVYLKAIQQIESGKDATPDLSLYNRVGDLYLKVNDTPSAVRHYERAVELYGDQGFFNNAIALCGKILRVNPGRTATYLHLARLHARKNVVIEAKRNLLEYLERMNAQGQLDEAFGAVKAFADQFSGSPDIRVMLIELLRAASRGEHAREELDRLCAQLEAVGGAGAARPPREQHDETEAAPETPAHRRRGGDLVFLDTGFGAPAASAPAAKEAPPVAAPEGLEVNAAFAEADSGAPEPEVAEPLGGFEATSFNAAPREASSFDLPDVQSDFDGIQIEGFEDDLALDKPADRPAGFDSTVEPDFDLSDVLAESLTEAEIPTASPAETEVTLDFIEAEPAEIELDEATAAPVEAAATISEVAAEAPLAPEPVPAEAAPPAAESRQSPMDALEQAVADRPEDPAAHHALAEALLAAGDTRRAADEFVFARECYEAREAWQEAGDMIVKLIRLEPDDIAHYQKLVELAYRTGSRGRMLEAYLSLAATLRRIGETEKAIAVYQRVLDHEPGNRAAGRALAELLGPSPEEEPPARRPARGGPPGAAPTPAAAAAPRVSGATPTPTPPSPTPPPAASVGAGAGSRDDFVDLGSLVLGGTARPRDTRMRVEGATPTDDEQKNFEETLAEFKRGIEQNLDMDDYQTHYDLGVAFKEMGLLDEAIAEFQKALRAPEGRLRTSEALGVAFFDKGQFGIAETVLRRGVDGEAGGDEAKIGLLYWLGRSAEAQGKVKDALRSYERALAVDIRFMDLGERVPRLTAGRNA